MNPALIAILMLTVLIVVILIKTAVIVPQKSEFIIERLGKYSRTMQAGFHLLIPFLDRVAYKYVLKEEVFDIPSQTCITKDNVTVEVDGLIYLQVVNSKLSAYGPALVKLIWIKRLKSVKPSTARLWNLLIRLHRHGE